MVIIKLNHAINTMKKLMNINNTADILHDVTSNTLLHLYITMNSTKGFTPILKRNQLLVSYLKKQLPKAHYKCIKKDLKLLILTGRKKTTNLEAKIIELNDLMYKHKQKSTDLKSFFDLLNLLETQYNQASLLFSKKNPITPDVLYVIPEHIEQCFNDNGNQTAPLSLLIQTNRPKQIYALIEKQKTFSISIKQTNQETKETHFQITAI